MNTKYRETKAQALADATAALNAELARPDTVVTAAWTVGAKFYDFSDLRPGMRGWVGSILSPYVAICREKRSRPWRVICTTYGSCQADAEDNLRYVAASEDPSLHRVASEREWAAMQAAEHLRKLKPPWGARPLR